MGTRLLAFFAIWFVSQLQPDPGTVMTPDPS